MTEQSSLFDKLERQVSKLDADRADQLTTEIESGETDTDRVCFECGASGGLHDHHVVPESRGGTETIPLCHECHGKAHGHPNPSDFDVSTLTRQALREKRENGQYTGGEVPYGKSKSEDGTLEEMDPIESVVVELRDDHGLSFADIGEQLEERGFEPKGEGFYARTVQRIYQRAST